MKTVSSVGTLYWMPLLPVTKSMVLKHCHSTDLETVGASIPIQAGCRLRPSKTVGGGNQCIFHNLVFSAVYILRKVIKIVATLQMSDFNIEI